MLPKVLKNSLPYFLIAGVAFFMFRGIFQPGFMSGTDNSFHYYSAYYLTRTLIPEYHWISGWSLGILAGFPVLVDYCQAGFLLIAFLNKALFLSLNLSYKITVLFSYTLLGAGFYKVASVRFGRIGALLAGVSLMLQKDIYYDRILSGIWNNYLAIGLFFIFFHVLDKHFENITLRKSLILGLFLSLLIISHLFVALFAVILLAIYAVGYLINAVNKKKLILKHIFFYFCIPASAIMITSYYLYIFIAERSYLAPFPVKGAFLGILWSLKALLGPLEKGQGLLSTAMLNIPVILRVIFSFFGIYICFKKEKDIRIKRFLINLLIFIFLALVLSSDILANLFSWWRSVPFVGNLRTNRFFIYAQIGMYLFAAYGTGAFLRHFRKKRLIVTACATGLLLSVFFHYNCLARDVSRTLDESRQMPNIYKIWNWINQNASHREGRIVYQNTMDNMDDSILNRSDVFALSGIFTKFPQIGVSPFPEGKYVRNLKGHIFDRKIEVSSGPFIKNMMDNFNSGYLVTVEPSLRNKLRTSESFIEEAHFGPFSIFGLKNPKGGWITFEKEASCKTPELDNQSAKFHIWNKSTENQAIIKISYHPLWRAWLNNKPVRIKQGKYELMEISLPDEGFYRLKLLFSSFNPLWVSVSLSSLVICIIVIARTGRRKRHEPRPS